MSVHKKLLDSDYNKTCVAADLTPGPVYETNSLNGETITVPAQLIDFVTPLHNLKSHQLQAKDIIISAYPKTGSHWCWEMMMMLSLEKAEPYPECKDAGWIDMSPVQEIYKKFEHLQRIPLSTHLPLDHIGEIRNSAKVVYLIRNPKDSLVSNFHHVNLVLSTKKNFNEYFTCYLYSKKNWWGSYFDHVGVAWDKYKNDPDVLILFYEDMKKNHKATVAKLAKFMAINASEELIDAIVKYTSFDTMKAAKQKTEEEWRSGYGGHATLYRKGEVGDWKNYFTVAQNEEFERFLDEWNKERKIPFVFS